MSQSLQRVLSINLTDSPRFWKERVLTGRRASREGRPNASRLSTCRLAVGRKQLHIANHHNPSPLQNFTPASTDTIRSFTHQSSNPSSTRTFPRPDNSVSLPQPPASREGSRRAQHDDPLTTGTRNTNGKHIETTRAPEEADTKAHVGEERCFGVRHHCPSANAYGEASQRPSRYTLAW